VVWTIYSRFLPTLIMVTCSYSDLTAAMLDKYPIYCLDDGVILRGRTPSEMTIEEVADNCLELVRRFAIQYGVSSDSFDRLSSQHEHTKGTIALGGWSYGGVVASIIANKLTSSNHAAASLSISTLIAFDCPFRKSMETHTADHKSSKGEPDMSRPEVAAHFRYCTKLLHTYYTRPVQTNAALLCPILDIRADQSDYDCSYNALEEVTKGIVMRHKVSGTHFSMLLAENAPKVARIINEFFESAVNSDRSIVHSSDSRGSPEM
jgi:surfactin synthase thioesterase subunit